MRFGGDWTEFVEAAQVSEPDDQEWAGRVEHAARPHFPGARATWFALMEHDGTPESLTMTLLHSSRPDIPAIFERTLGAIVDDEPFRAFFFPPHLATTHSEVQRALQPAAASHTRRVLHGYGMPEMIGLVTRPALGKVVLAGALVDRPTSLTASERVALTRAALHLEAGYRLRKRPDLVKAVLDASGRLVERIDESPALDALPRLSTSDIELWPALVAGRFSLVPRGKGRSRRFTLLENPPEARRFRALTPFEVEVLRLTTRGLSTKLATYALGVSSTTISTALASASAKIGAANRVELVRIAALLTRRPSACAPTARFTASERDVLALLQQGLSNEAIARMRNRSVRTIANQVAALLRKSGTSSRRELASRT